MDAMVGVTEGRQVLTRAVGMGGQQTVFLRLSDLFD